MRRGLKLSYLTEREKQIYKLVQELGSQKEAAKRLGIVDSAVTSALKSVRLKVMKLLNTLEECLDMGLLTAEDLSEYTSRAVEKPKKSKGHR
ncbi:MAG: hypothetical protein ACE5GD_11300 [Candidatus Geothermarchaeales archaeon]